MTALRLALGVTLILLGALMLLGMKLQLSGTAGRSPSARHGPPRAVHHVLYFLICLGTLLSGALSLLGGRTWWPLLLLLALLLGMGRTRPGRPTHWRLALLIGVLYAGTAWWLW